MAIDLTGKRILITGSTDGLGLKLALELARSGVEIIIHGRDQNKIQNTLDQLNQINQSSGSTNNTNHSSILCDFNDPASIENAFGSIQELDILVNNAGVWYEGATLDIPHSKIIEMVNVNITSYLMVARTMLPVLLKSEYAQILNVISVAGQEVPTEYFHTIYSATKYALQGFSEAMEKEFTGENLRVMGFYPGGMDTDLFKKAGLDYAKGESWMFDMQESVEAMMFMLTRSPKINIKRLDLVNHLD